MKKVFAAFLLFIYLFNLGGQLVLHQYFSYLSDKFFNEQTSKGLYNVNDLTEVKIPINMPDITDWKSYQNIAGQIQFNNSSYNYVKMKITRHALYLMCIPDYKATRLAAGNIISIKQVKGVAVPKKEHVPYGKIAISGQFSFAFTQFAFSSHFKITPVLLIQPGHRLVTADTAIPHQPPRFSC